MGGRTKEFMKLHLNKGNKGGKKINPKKNQNSQNGKFRKGFFAKKTRKR